MAKVYLICGKIGCGKSTYAKKLMKKHNAVLLSIDEIMLALFGQDAGENHDVYSKRLQAYLYHQSLELVASGISVILDFGFWTNQERANARRFFQSNNIPVEWHYLHISQAEWERRLAKRNAEVAKNESKAYFVDEGLKKKCEALFEAPQREEIHVWIEA